MTEKVNMLLAKDVARILKIPLARVYALAKAGDLTTVKIGRYIRFPENALQTWMDNGGAAQKNGRPGPGTRASQRGRSMDHDSTFDGITATLRELAEGEKTLQAALLALMSLVSRHERWIDAVRRAALKGES